MDQTFFIRVQLGPEARTLHPARLITGGASSSLVELPAEDVGSLRLETGGRVIACFYRGHTFVEQPARIESCAEVQREGERILTMALAHLGDPAPAESRQCFRVSTVMQGLSVTLDGEDCPLLDISATGLSAMSRASHAIGDTLDAAFSFDENEYAGAVCVQSARELGERGTRYGLECLRGEESPGDLSRGLRLASMAVQREHLRRLARLR